MLAGSNEFIKPYRLDHSFLHAALGRNITNEVSQDIIIAAHRLLAQDHPTLTPKSLDYLIWRYQRDQ